MSLGAAARGTADYAIAVVVTFLFLDSDDAARAPIAAALAPWLAEQIGVSLTAYSAGVRPSHVRPEVRQVLNEIGAPTAGLHAKNVRAVPLDEITAAVRLAPDLLTRLPDVPVLDWHLPDPSSAPPPERLDAYRATRDELVRRLRILLTEPG